MGVDPDGHLLQEVARAALAQSLRARRRADFASNLKAAYLRFLLLPLAITLVNDLVQVLVVQENLPAPVEVRGVIANDSRASADHVITGLRRPSRQRPPRGSSGASTAPGSAPSRPARPRRILRLRTKYCKPVYAVASDRGAPPPPRRSP
jgi:protease-4